MNSLKILLCILVLPLVSSCYYLQSTSTPIKSIPYSFSDNPIDHIVILMPGIGDGAKAFEDAGFIAELNHNTVSFNALAVDTHFGYFKEKSLTRRMFLDFLQPLRKKYKKITLLGISLGGYGALRVASEYPEYVDQIILVAPYLGNGTVSQEIRQQGGLKNWYQSNANLSSGNAQEFGDNAWTWLYQIIFESQTKLILTFGNQDKFSDSAMLIAEYLPAKQIITQDGKHNWNTWLKLWKEILAKDLLS